MNLKAVALKRLRKCKFEEKQMQFTFPFSLLCSKQHSVKELGFKWNPIAFICHQRFFYESEFPLNTLHTRPYSSTSAKQATQKTAQTYICSLGKQLFTHTANSAENQWVHLKNIISLALWAYRRRIHICAFDISGAFNTNVCIILAGSNGEECCWCFS